MPCSEWCTFGAKRGEAAQITPNGRRLYAIDSMPSTPRLKDQQESARSAKVGEISESLRDRQIGELVTRSYHPKDDFHKKRCV